MLLDDARSGGVRTLTSLPSFFSSARFATSSAVGPSSSSSRGSTRRHASRSLGSSGAGPSASSSVLESLSHRRSACAPQRRSSSATTFACESFPWRIRKTCQRVARQHMLLQRREGGRRGKCQARRLETCDKWCRSSSRRRGADGAAHRVTHSDAQRALRREAHLELVVRRHGRRGAPAARALARLHRAAERGEVVVERRFAVL